MAVVHCQITSSRLAGAGKAGKPITWVQIPRTCVVKYGDSEHRSCIRRV